MTKTSEVRKNLWHGISKLYLDTEFSLEDMKELTQDCSASEFGEHELYQIYAYEVTPVCFSNLLSVAGEWAYFSDLEEEIEDYLKSTRILRKIPIIHQIITFLQTFMTRGDWKKIMRVVKLMRISPKQIETQLQKTKLRSQILHDLVFLGPVDKNIVNAIVPSLQSPNSNICILAIKTLCAISRDDPSAYIFPLLKVNNSKVRLTAIKWLCALAIQNCSDITHQQRFLSLEKPLLTTATIHFEEQHIQTLLSVIDNDKEQKIKVEAINLLGFSNYHEVITKLMLQANNQNLEIRAATAMAMAYLAKEPAKLYQELINSKENNTRHCAILFCKELFIREINILNDFQELTDLLNDKCLQVRMDTIATIGVYRPFVASQVTCLVGLLENKEIKIRIAATNALSHIGTKAQQAIPQLLNLLQEKNLELLQRTLWALKLVVDGKLSEEQLIEIKKLTNHKDASISVSASLLLKDSRSS